MTNHFPARSSEHVPTVGSTGADSGDSRAAGDNPSSLHSPVSPIWLGQGDDGQAQVEQLPRLRTSSPVPESNFGAPMKDKITNIDADCKSEGLHEARESNSIGKLGPGGLSASPSEIHRAPTNSKDGEPSPARMDLAGDPIYEITQ